MSASQRNEFMAALLDAIKDEVLDEIETMSPEHAKKLLLYLVEDNYPPGFVLDLCARKYTKPEFLKTLDEPTSTDTSKLPEAPQ